MVSRVLKIVSVICHDGIGRAYRSSERLRFTRAHFLSSNQRRQEGCPASRRACRKLQHSAVSVFGGAVVLLVDILLCQRIGGEGSMMWTCPVGLFPCMLCRLADDILPDTGHFLNFLKDRKEFEAEF